MKCVAGENLRISLEGMSSQDATLIFNGYFDNRTLVSCSFIHIHCSFKIALRKQRTGSLTGIPFAFCRCTEVTHQPRTLAAGDESRSPPLTLLSITWTIPMRDSIFWKTTVTEKSLTPRWSWSVGFKRLLVCRVWDPSYFLLTQSSHSTHLWAYQGYSNPNPNPEDQKYTVCQL